MISVLQLGGTDVSGEVILLEGDTVMSVGSTNLFVLQSEGADSSLQDATTISLLPILSSRI